MKRSLVVLLLICALLAWHCAVLCAAEPQTDADAYTYDELFGSGSDTPPALTEPAAEGEGESESEDEAQTAPEAEAEANAEPENQSSSDTGEESAPDPEAAATAEPETDPVPESEDVGETDAAPETQGEQDDAPANATDTEAPPETEANPGEGESGLITNVFYDTDLRQALSDVAAQAGVVIIPDSTVQGYVTADLVDIPLEDALRMLLVSGGFVFKQMNGYYLVGAPDPANPNFHLLSETEVIELNYVDGTALAAYLAGPYGRYVTIEGAPAPLPERERAAYRRPTTRQVTGGTRLFITAPREIIQRIKADLAKIDVPRTQVMLEAVVLEVSEEGLKEIGIDWASRWVRFASEAMAIGGNAGGSQSAETFPAGSLSYSELSFVQTAQLQALVQKGKARLRANPRVTTIEGQTAEIEVGQEKYFAIVTGPVTFPYTTLEQIPAGITLRITPTVIEETREVIARVEPEVRDVTGKGPTGLPEITYRRASTTVRVKDGESIVIGGLITEFQTRAESKFPLLGDIPLIGNLFRRVSSREVTSEVVIIITPHILGDTEQ